MEFREKSLVIINDNPIAFKEGDTCEVEFDFLDIWEYIKNNEIDLKTANIVFCHTHIPGSSSKASSTDVNCMKGLFIALNIPINFVICVFKDDLTFDTHGIDVSSYICDEEGISPVDNNTQYITQFSDRLVKEVIKL